ncbi:MAG: hypothetical protein ABW034_24310 [Steroidobacteraceae bacterium]
MNTRRLSVMSALMMLLVCLAMPSFAEPSGKWRIKLNHTAENNGTIVLRIAPVSADPIDVETKIPANTSENHAADILRDSLRASLGEGYHVEIDDGEDVLIKKRGKTPKFDLTLVNSSLTGLQIEIKHD